MRNLPIPGPGDAKAAAVLSQQAAAAALIAGQVPGKPDATCVGDLRGHTFDVFKKLVLNLKLVTARLLPAMNDERLSKSI